MQPPPYPSTPPAPRSNTKIIWAVVIGVLSVCCLGVIGFGWLGFRAFNQVKPLVGCAMAFESTRDAIIRYAEKNGGKLPNAATWMDDVEAELKNRPRDQQEAERVLGIQTSAFACNFDGTKTGMAFNSDLSGKKLSEIQNPTQTVLIFEVKQAQRNQAMKFAPSNDAPPKVMGSARTWMTANVQGDVDMEVNGQRIDSRGQSR